MLTLIITQSKSN